MQKLSKLKLEKISFLKIIFYKICKWFFVTIGIFSFLILLLSFTDLPYYAYHYLGTNCSELKGKPDIIVVLGGSGMPSPDGLIRTYYGAEAALKYKTSKVIIALPYNEFDSLYQLNLMAHELIIKGVDSLRIIYEPFGYNTHSQALKINEMLGIAKSKSSILIVTSPQHMYRAIKTFRKVGFVNVGGEATFENPEDKEMLKDKDHAFDFRIKNLDLRYNMWSYLNYELLVLREYVAIAYYKLKNWI